MRGRAGHRLDKGRAVVLTVLAGDRTHATIRCPGNQ